MFFFLKKSTLEYLINGVLIILIAICLENATSFALISNLLPEPGLCGNILWNKIYGGTVAKIDEFPWMARIEYTKVHNAKGYHCGGSLVNNRYVLTAAHCVNGQSIPSDWRLTAVRLGEWNTLTNPDCEIDVRGEKYCAPACMDIPIEQAIPHPLYIPSSRNQANDIALLRMERSISYTDFVSPICLPITTNLRSATFEGIAMDVAGWGKTENASVSDVKLKASVSGYTPYECSSAYMRQNITIQDSQICAGGKKGIDSCTGDSGGPLMGINTSNRILSYFLIGVVSFGPTPCGSEGWPGVYTRVGSFVDWIAETIKA